MRRLKKATLTDVAQRAGVSVTTASYILNGRSSQMRISPATEQRVQAAMQDLDYRPNRTARTLRGSSTQTIGVISDFVASGDFSSRLLSGATAAARLSDHVLLIGETLGNPEVERLLVEEMLDREVDGVVYVTVSASRVELPEKLRKARTVLLNCCDPSVDLPCVVVDDVAGGQMAVAHLLAAGVTGEIHAVGEDSTPDATAGGDRMEGIAQALTEAGRALDGVVSCRWDAESAYDAVTAWLDSGGRPAALICLNDRVALGAYQALAEHGRKVPEDVAVISFDGSDLASWLRPRLTTVELPFTAMGKRAIEVLMDPGWRTVGAVRLEPCVQPGASV